MRGPLHEILRAALAAADAAQALHAHVLRRGPSLAMAGRTIDLDACERVVVLAAGKAAAPMCRAAEEILGDRLTESLAVVPYGYGLDLKRTEIIQAGHPVPDQAGIEAAQRMLGLAHGLGPRDLTLVLLSGGASALLPAPRPPLTLAHKQAATDLLLASGAAIGEINAVRKHLSTIKGGGLARALAPAATATLAVSDVIGDPWDVIGSGPTVADPTTFQDCLDICSSHAILDRLPWPVRSLLQAGAAGREPETLKPGDPCLATGLHRIILNNAQCLDAAAAKARAMGYATSILETPLQGEARDAAVLLAAKAREAARSGPLPACILAGGETTVTVCGSGTGGRNQELALSLALVLEKDPELRPRLHAACCGTDGRDGTTHAAGAFIGPKTMPLAEDLGLDARAMLHANDSHTFFHALGDLIVTGPTRTNVMDLAVLLIA